MVHITPYHANSTEEEMEGKKREMLPSSLPPWLQDPCLKLLLQAQWQAGDCVLPWHCSRCRSCPAPALPPAWAGAIPLSDHHAWCWEGGSLSAVLHLPLSVWGKGNQEISKIKVWKSGCTVMPFSAGCWAHGRALMHLKGNSLVHPWAKWVLWSSKGENQTQEEDIWICHLPHKIKWGSSWTPVRL